MCKLVFLIKAVKFFIIFLILSFFFLLSWRAPTMYPQCVGISTHTVPSNCNCTKFALNHLETVTLPPAAMDLRVRQEGAPSPVSPGTCFSSRAHSSRVEREMTDSPCLLQYLLAVFSAHHLRDYRSYRWSCGKGSRGLSQLRKRGCHPSFLRLCKTPVLAEVGGGGWE